MLSIAPAPITGSTPVIGADIGRTAGNLVIPPQFVNGSESNTSGLSAQLTLAFGNRNVATPLDQARSGNLLRVGGRRYFGLPVIAVSFACYVDRAVTPGSISNYGGDETLVGMLYVAP